ncbi:MAG: RsmG family class I SAM-dependent methyltransferase [Elusimicrobiota bacterium]
MNDDPLRLLHCAAAEWGARLDAPARDRIVDYLSFVRERNQATNLTSDDSWRALALKHAADGVFAASRLRALTPSAPRILDLGSGAGFIGITMKIAWPQADVTLMESVERKYRFLNAAATRLGLPGLHVLHRRAGSGAPLTSYERDRDVVIERAAAALPQALRTAWPMLAPRGLFAAFQTAEPDFTESTITKSLVATGARVLKSFPYRRPADELERRLVIFSHSKE